jgi:hypothetical protein
MHKIFQCATYSSIELNFAALCTIKSLSQPKVNPKLYHGMSMFITVARKVSSASEL